MELLIKSRMRGVITKNLKVVQSKFCLDTPRSLICDNSSSFFFTELKFYTNMLCTHTSRIVLSRVKFWQFTCRSLNFNSEVRIKIKMELYDYLASNHI